MSTNTILASAPLTATGYHLKATGTTLGQSLIWDNGTNVGIGNTNTSYTLDVSGTGRFTSTLLVSGAATFGSTLDTADTITLTKSQNAATSIKILNTNVGSAASQSIFFDNDARANLMTLRGYSNAAGSSIPDISDSVLLRSNGAGGLTLSAQEATGVIRFSTGGVTERMRITSGGVVQINNTDACYINFQTSGVSKTFIGSAGTSSDIISGAAIGDTVIRAQQKMLFATGGDTERMRITSGGDVQFQKVGGSPSSGVGFTYYYGATAPFLSLVGDNTYVYFYNQTAGAYRFYVQGNGQINATSTSITAISDISLKENIRDLETGLSEILKLKPRRFDWKEETKIGEKNVAGFIAQELESILPELVYEYQYNDKETKKSIKMGDILPTLVKAIQEQNQTIEELSNRLIKLESK